MLLLKAIGKVVGGIIGTFLVLAAGLAGFLFAVWVIGFVLKWVYILLATIIPGFAAFTAFLAGSVSYILVGLAILGIATILVLDVREQYRILKNKEARKNEVLG